jgi:hypothetical protein
MEEPYVKKYASSFYYWLYFMVAVYVASFWKLYQYYGINSHREDLIAFICMLLFFTLSTALAIVLKYRVIYLYNDRLVMQNAFKKELMRVRFDNIYRIGFLNATTDSVSSTEGGSSEAVELVMLLKDGGSEDLDSTIISDMDMNYTFIKERMTDD